MIVVSFLGRHFDNLATWQWDSTINDLAPEPLAAPVTAVEDKYVKRLLLFVANGCTDLVKKKALILLNKQVHEHFIFVKSTPQNTT